jgi:hypothetical protein
VLANHPAVGVVLYHRRHTNENNHRNHHNNSNNSSNKSWVFPWHMPQSF